MVEGNTLRGVPATEGTPVSLIDFAKQEIARLKSRKPDGSLVRLPDLLGEQYPAYERLALAYFAWHEAARFTTEGWQALQDEVKEAKSAGLSSRRIAAAGERTKGIYYDWLLIKGVAKEVRRQDAELLSLENLGPGVDPQIFTMDGIVDGIDFADADFDKASRIIRSSGSWDY